MQQCCKEASLLQLKLLIFFPHIFEEVFSLRFFFYLKRGVIKYQTVMEFLLFLFDHLR